MKRINELPANNLPTVQSVWAKAIERDLRQQGQERPKNPRGGRPPQGSVVPEFGVGQRGNTKCLLKRQFVTGRPKRSPTSPWRSTPPQPAHRPGFDGAG